jgi:hypothetical protein
MNKFDFFHYSLLFQTTGAEIENCFQTFGPVHDVKIIAKENTSVYERNSFSQINFRLKFFRHFAFISFVNDTTALDVLRQHAIVPITFQNRPIILAPAYKKTNLLSSTSTICFSMKNSLEHLSNVSKICS